MCPREDDIPRASRRNGTRRTLSETKTQPPSRVSDCPLYDRADVVGFASGAKRALDVTPGPQQLAREVGPEVAGDAREEVGVW